MPPEVSKVHTRILRLALGVEESRAYWSHLDPDVPAPQRALIAFEQRWFGSKSMERVRYLLASFQSRYDIFPEALPVLCRWRAMDPVTRQNICHWHLQLSDPLYRRFTSSFLVQRRLSATPALDRDRVIRWLNEEHKDRWSAATIIQFASKLMAAASEAGTLTTKSKERLPVLPKVTPESLAYLLYLLRGITYQGTLLDNPYLLSVGLEGPVLEQRLRSLPGISYQRMGELDDLEWAYPNLLAWAEATIL